MHPGVFGNRGVGNHVKLCAGRPGMLKPWGQGSLPSTFFNKIACFTIVTLAYLRP